MEVKEVKNKEEFGISGMTISEWGPVPAIVRETIMMQRATDRFLKSLGIPDDLDAYAPKVYYTLLIGG